MATRTPNLKQQALLDFYMADPTRNATKAAQRAGYRNPRVEGSRIVRQFRHLLDSKVSSEDVDPKISLEEAMKHLADVCRNPQHKDHLGALKLALQVHGALSEKPMGDQKVLRVQLEELLKSNKAPQPESKPKSAKPKLTLVRSA